MSSTPVPAAPPKKPAPCKPHKPNIPVVGDQPRRDEIRAPDPVIDIRDTPFIENEPLQCAKKLSPFMAAIEKEFDEPFWDVVAGFARDKHSINDTALILGYASPSSFRRLVNRHNRRHLFCNQLECVGRADAAASRRGVKPPQHVIDAMAAANPNYRYIVRNGIRDTIAGHARRAGVSYRTVIHRIGRGVAPESAFSKTPMYVSPNNANHPWRRNADAKSPTGASACH